MSKICAHPGCQRVLRTDSMSGVCRAHNHTAACRCVQCAAVRGGGDAVAVIEDPRGVAPRPVMVSNPQACRALFAAVIQAAIDDALRPVTLNSYGRLSGAGAEILQARSWIGSKRMRRMCWLAGLDDEAVVEALRPRIAAVAAQDAVWS